MKNFEEIIETLTTEQKSDFETAIGMGIDDFLGVMNEEPLTKLVAEILLNKALTK